MNLKKIRSEDLIFSNEIEDDRTNTYLTLNDYDWMNYNLSTRFKTEEMGVLEVEFEFFGFSTSQMNVKQTLNGKVHEIRSNILHLMRGEVFIIEDKKFFTFGGASSHDIQDGILDYNDKDWRKKAKELNKQGKYMYRIKDLSWWPEELPADKEMQYGFDRLRENDNIVDYIITHSPSTSELYLMGGKGLYEPDILTNYLEEVKAATEYKKHLFGHMHINRAINDKDICLYEQIIRVL